LFGFHKQPEASIDVCGRYFENQFENVVNLWRQLPPDWYLVIKEHSNAIGDRSFNFFRKLRKYPRVILMNEKEDSHVLIQNAQLVATNTGTMALEAALMNIPAITLSRVFFNKLNYCRHCTWVDFEKYNSITDLIAEIKSVPNNIEEYTEFIMKNSFDGLISDVVSNPEVILPGNIEQLSKAVMEITEFSAV
jgi:UDP-N-acetylglucosamine 2-epimerase